MVGESDARGAAWTWWRTLALTSSGRRHSAPERASHSTLHAQGCGQGASQAAAMARLTTPAARREPTSRYPRQPRATSWGREAHETKAARETAHPSPTEELVGKLLDKLSGKLLGEPGDQARLRTW